MNIRCNRCGDWDNPCSCEYEPRYNGLSYNPKKKSIMKEFGVPPDD